MEPIDIPASTHIASADFRVANMERALSFYRDRLGFRTVEVQLGEARLSATGQPPYLLRLVELASAKPKPPHSTGLYHLAIRLPDRTALANLLVHMLEVQTAFQGASDHLVSEAIYLSDSEGNGLELYVDRPRESWPSSGDQITMDTRRLDLDDLMAQADPGSAGWQGIDPGTDIGHIHLQVADLHETEAFYHSLLGFQVTQRTYPGALFFAAGGYHHHIGTNIWNSRAVPPPPPDSAGLLSFRVSIANGNYLETIIRRLEEAGRDYKRQADPEGRESLLVQDPSANLIDLTFDSTKTD